MYTRLISRNGGVEYLFGEKKSNKYWIETNEANQKHLGKAKTLLALLLKHGALKFTPIEVSDELFAIVFYPSFAKLDLSKMFELIKSCNPQIPSAVLPVRTKTGLMKQTGSVIFFKEAHNFPLDSNNEEKYVKELFIELQEFVAKNTEWLAYRKNPIEVDLFTLQSNFESTLSWGDFPCLTL